MVGVPLSVPMGRILRSRHVGLVLCEFRDVGGDSERERGLGCMHLNGPVTEREVL